ncbi:MAG: glucosaminidase domain-containing protein [Pelagibacteraceae bacterium]|jgi:Bax protein|nr:glucosaminidase domain-containing protein [Pelagibacteraceae bacterium]|tara:strand:+ start:15085 stop:16305 length:1221 start_codon:yes stop_codon:yes gene_type:complete
MSYRKQLIQLAKFYGIVEIKNYFKGAKRLTTSQIELILIKNNIKLPSKKISSSLGRLIIFKDKYLRQPFYVAVVVAIVIGFFGGAPYLINVFHKVDYNLWKDKDKIAKHKNDTIDEILKKNEIKSYKKDENFVVSEKIIIKKDNLIENTISLDASVVSSLFEDLNYDLSKIRKGKKVKPFYISLLPKDLSLIEDVRERKELFIKIILPLILQENEKIEKDRKKLFRLLAKKSNTKGEKDWLKWKFKEYKIKNRDISELKIRMDIVPVSLAIAQAAIESGWGTSRFALEGNALYGQWTWSDKGLKPLKNVDGDHKVMHFKILTASIKAYKKNLNTHSGYIEFREARAKLRNLNERVTGLKLTQYLDKYSATGMEYTKKLELTIKKNSLSDFENAKLLSTGLRKEIKL